MKSTLRFALLTSLAVAGCKKNKSANSADDARQFRETKIELESCDTASAGADKIDADQDGNPEIVRVMKGDRELCRTIDLNLDGQVDRTVYFDDAGKQRRTESDFDRDGLVDEIATFEAGQLTEKYRATTMDGKLDTWEFYENGKLSRTERDENGDGVIDQWWEYPSRGCPLIHVDADGDGRPDPGASIDYCKETGYTPPPVAGDDSESTPPPSDFGKEVDRVEELSDVKAGSEPDAAPADKTNDGSGQ